MQKILLCLIILFSVNGFPSFRLNSRLMTHSGLKMSDEKGESSSKFNPIDESVDFKIMKILESELVLDFKKTPDHVYSSMKQGHVGKEKFPFDHEARRELSQEVVKFMEERKEERAKAIGDEKKDKTLNPIIAIPGSPGIGKTAFLINFAESQPYTDYIKKQYPTKEGELEATPIVSALTFNSGMDETPDDKANDFGLRILFGGLKCMSNHYQVINETSWTDFLMIFQKHSHVLPRPRVAVDILQKIYSRPGSTPRPMLLMVDEASKCPKEFEEEIMRSICSLLNSYGDLDLLMSSLSPQYINDLFSGSNRPIYYVAATPIPDARLMKPGVEKWITKLNETGGFPTERFAQEVLRNVDLLTSGHPRFQEFLLNKIQKLFISKSDIEAGELIVELAVNIAPKYPGFRKVGEESFENFILNPVPVSPTLPGKSKKDILSTDFRKALEIGEIMCIKDPSSNFPADTNEFLSLVTLSSFIKFLKEVNTLIPDISRYPRTSSAYILFRDLLKGKNGKWQRISVWFERAIAVTIVCKWVTDIMVADVLNIKNLDSKINVELTSRLEPIFTKNNTTEELQRILEGGKNQLILTSEHFPGVDMIAQVGGKEENELRFYLNPKIRFPSSTKSLPRVVAKTIVNTLVNVPGFSLKDSHFVLYIWDDFDHKLLTVDEVMEEMKKLVERKNNIVLGNRIGAERELEILGFINDHFFTNIHFVDRKNMEKWLIPTLTIIPRIVEEVEKEKH